MANHVDGKVIIITGAAGGFGRLVAQKTAALGARVVASDVNEAELAIMVDTIIANGGRIDAEHRRPDCRGGLQPRRADRGSDVQRTELVIDPPRRPP
jgi:NAD(P)-dependent dehydrogenase (short-subunit alcohol dehydrogenase family)